MHGFLASKPDVFSSATGEWSLRHLRQHRQRGFVDRFRHPSGVAVLTVVTMPRPSEPQPWLW
jgi:hypothetical protein